MLDQFRATQNWVKRSRPARAFTGAQEPATPSRYLDAGKDGIGDDQDDCVEGDQVKGRVRCRTATWNALSIVRDEA